MAFSWDATLATNVPHIDQQHRELIQRINGLLEAMKAGKGKDDIGGLLKYVKDYTAKHFRDEEAEMARRNSPVAEMNKKAHQQFINAIDQLTARFNSEGPTPTLVLEMQRRLLDWLVSHIRAIDTKLAQPSMAAAAR